LTVPTVTFNVLYVSFVLSLEHRRVLLVNVTTHPYAKWAAQQIVEAIGAEIVPERVIRHLDSIFGTEFDVRVDHLGIEHVKITPRSPRQNAYAEQPQLGKLAADRRVRDPRKTRGTPSCSPRFQFRFPVDSRFLQG
jgi:hypothetical protein